MYRAKLILLLITSREHTVLNIVYCSQHLVSSPMYIVISTEPVFSQPLAIPTHVSPFVCEHAPSDVTQLLTFSCHRSDSFRNTRSH